MVQMLLFSQYIPMKLKKIKPDIGSSPPPKNNNNNKGKKYHSYKLAHMLPFDLQLAQSFHAYAFLAKCHYVQFTSYMHVQKFKTESEI